MGESINLVNDFKVEKIIFNCGDAKLKRDNVYNEYTANSVYYEVGKKVRKSIKRLVGTMPENLSTPDKNLKKLEKEKKNQLINKKI